ncbi:hypothetical protein H1C71_009386 [Ictidomys tridecemlineatus]|uniref:Chromosome 11 open reading frame 16 n=2 Tax=Ictidomys tridecemlineatus TaxID=43179 RepID=I3M0I3_ICTTR|nr:uncharacterized protein C11orf16 homolog isoform X3 [Ictidomys tridecemlineatus]XP_040140716.1 uncharacterized protein C11orf16 homolog isoform X3 [Ictidomys tridecemlineatus]XP_040140717.1 uncharacterized protein C11orf16 homolog isoform X3 [Ictidomys tridecemlineatus]XP_040140718.1 uncharacterized protein C11orf16 homolog isoform X3 [Ictidomys tridecemlineatus]KAG3285762.1 hypothetical protein H1C71_009386 [Ictidomys tridecemlineatus]
MQYSTQLGMPLPKYCSVATTLKTPGWNCAAPFWDLSFTCPFALRAPYIPRHHAFTRYSSYHQYLHIADPAWQGPGCLGRVGGATDTWVLARREPDGFYYLAQIKAAPELEKQGILLVEYEVPLVMCPNLPPQKQSVVLEEDVIQLSPSRDYSLQPGDKVLAPWEADRQRYGPGTVLLGLETKDPQRASKEEITVHFWNGKTAKVPQGGVRWVPPAAWKKAVERLHWPCTREDLSPLLWAPCCSLLGPVTGCTTNLPPLDAPFLCPPCQPHACCQLLCQGCFCCCSLMGPTWWPLTRTSEITAREFLESGLKPTAQLLPLEGSKEEAVAVHAPMAVSSSSSSSCEESENELEMGLPQRLMVNSAVNTDPILPEKCWRQSGPCQPEWRYWRRNASEPRPGKPGTRGCNIWKEEKDNKQQRVQTAVVGTTKELTLKATNVKPLQTPPEEAEHRKLSQGHIQGTRIPKNSN